MSITRDVMTMKGTKDLKQMRAAIDAKYSGFGRGTPTGLP